jgi:general secretion pathway protein E
MNAALDELMAATVSTPGLGAATIATAVAVAARERRAVFDVLEETAGLDADQLAEALARAFDYPLMSASELMPLEPAFDVLSSTEALRRHCVLVQRQGQMLAVFADPFTADLRPWLELRVPGVLQWALASRFAIAAYVARHEQSMRAIDTAVETAQAGAIAGRELENLSLNSISQDQSPIVKLVHSTVYDALRAGASDIHLETGNAVLVIRYRIDGVLVQVATVTGTEVSEQVISRIKVMSELDIAERRVPQDGRFKIAIDGRPIDFRVSIIPSVYGEDAVLRILDKQAITDQMKGLRLDALGFDPWTIGQLRRLSSRPYGMLLVTGPTGSGKTTTLYAAISETNSGTDKIVTIEDPVEYQLPGVLQIPVNEKKGLTFARGLRSILRHDPDKIMVGEIRDPETAQIAIQSALTGHLVFTTVHANNVFDVLSRFVHMGVDAHGFVAALNGILAQRLVRVLCVQCAESVMPPRELLEESGISVPGAATFHFRQGRGCKHCRGSGYRGRKAVGELLVLNDELREGIIARLPVRQLKEMARSTGMRLIRSAAIDLVRRGETTIEEVNRVTTLA